MKNFKTYQLAKELYLECLKLEIKGELRDQLHRASLSIVLNLAEGSGKITAPDQRRFYSIAFGSLRETQALVDLLQNKQLIIQADKLGASLWRLMESIKPKPRP
jgi:four helix bundle protein